MAFPSSNNPGQRLVFKSLNKERQESEHIIINPTDYVKHGVEENSFELAFSE